MARKKRLAEDAAAFTIYLTPEERLVLNVIAGRRQKRTEPRDSPSEIISDALWRFLADIENVQRQQIDLLMPARPKKDQSNVKRFPKKENR